VICELSLATPSSTPNPPALQKVTWDRAKMNRLVLYVAEGIQQLLAQLRCSEDACRPEIGPPPERAVPEPLNPVGRRHVVTPVLMAV
jgi:hypothetical protein